ncbi:DUF1080 domain-containing protein [bacterium]|nr:DUF1080 domain-containing protein [bacterium]
MKKQLLFLVSAIIFAGSLMAQSTSVAPVKLSNKWLYLLDNQFSNFDKFIGIPHYSITNLPDYPKGNGMEGTPIGLNKDPLNVFSMITENNEHVLKITGEIYAGLSTKEEYDNYHLSVQFKWGEKKYEPRLNKLRDNGILYHCCSEHGSFWNVWMRSIEMQVQEGEMGDLYALSKRRLLVPSKLDSDSVFMYEPKGKLEAYGELEPRIKGRCKSPKHYEKPNGEWNTLELICVGDTSLHIVNGAVVNMIIEDTKTEMANNDPYKRKGKIQFQSEGAEAYYKDIKIRKATRFPKEILKQL